MKNTLMILLGLLIGIIVTMSIYTQLQGKNARSTMYSAEDYNKGFQYGSKEELYDLLYNSLLKGNSLSDDKKIGVRNYSYNLAKNKYDSLKGMYPEGSEIPLSEVERLVNVENPNFYQNYNWLPNTDKIAYMFGNEYSDLGKLFDLASFSLFNDNTDITDNPLAGLIANTPEEKRKYIDAILEALKSGEYTRGSDRASKNNILRSYINKNYQALQPKSREQNNTFNPSSYDLDPYKVITKEDAVAFDNRVNDAITDITNNPSISTNDKFKAVRKIKDNINSYLDENKRRNSMAERGIPPHLDYIMQQVARGDDGYEAEAELVRKEVEAKRAKAKEQAEYDAWEQKYLQRQAEAIEARKRIAGGILNYD